MKFFQKTYIMTVTVTAETEEELHRMEEGDFSPTGTAELDETLAEVVDDFMDELHNITETAQYTYQEQEGPFVDVSVEEMKPVAGSETPNDAS